MRIGLAADNGTWHKNRLLFSDTIENSIWEWSEAEGPRV